MATLQTLLSPQMIERLGWTLVHFVWQAAAVALLLAVVLRCFRRSSSNVRYVVSCLAMVLIAALPLVTMSLVEASRPVAEAGPILDTAPMSVVPVEVIEVVELPLEPFGAVVPEMPERVGHMPWTLRAASAIEPALPWLVSGWLLGVFGLSAWHLGGWAQLQRMKRRMVRQVAEPLRAALADLSSRLGVRRTVGLLESALVEVPTVVGWLKPVILLPASALSGLSTEQLEAILAHELAHVRRCDYLVNLAQTVIEILGFYHPAVWWISHRIRDERENCCDDLAVQTCGDSRRYARALTCLEELRHHTTELAVAASGGSLVGRIARLLGRPPVDHRRFAWLPGLIALLVVVAILIPAALLIAAPTVPQPLNTEADSAEAAGDDNVAPTRLVHRNVEGRADREFGFERLIREEGDHWIVAIPYSTQSVGKMRCHVHADRGELRLDGALNQPTPDGGTLRGNVVIEITSSDPNSIDACTLYLDEVTFSAQNKRFTSSGPVRLVCGATELAGRGLELSFDEPPDRSEPSRLTVIDGLGVQSTPSGSLIVSLVEPKTEVPEKPASRQPASVRAQTETADSRAPSPDEKPRVMLDIEPSADAADRQVLLSFTMAEIVTEEALDRATARQLRALLTDASPDAKFNLPSVEELQKPVQYIVSKYANICNQIDDAARAFTDLLVSRGYATVCASPEMLIRLGESGHLRVMGPPAPPSQTDNSALSLDVTPTAPHDANGIRLTLALRARNLVSLDSKGGLSSRAATATFNLALSARNNQGVLLPLTTAVAPDGNDLDAKTATTLFLIKPTLVEPSTPPALAPSASEQATADAAREFVRTDPMVHALMQRIAQLEVELIEARQMLSPQSPLIAQKEQLLEALHRRLDARRHEFQQEIRDFLARTPDADAGRMPETTDAETGSSKTGAVEVTARFVLVDPECLNALRQGLPIEGITAVADVNALHALGDDLAEGRTPLLAPDGVEQLLKTVRQYTQSKMLAAPKVIVRDGESASMHLGDTIRYVRGYREPNDGSPDPIPQQASKEIGVRLDATPRIIEDHNDIRLQFEMEITSLLATQKALYQGKHEYDVPTFTTVTTATEIVVPDGQTVLIHAGPVRSLGATLGNESDLPRPLLMLIRPRRTKVEPPATMPPVPENRRPGDPGMGALPPGVNVR